MQEQERAIVLIDGGNFYFKLRDLHLSRLLAFDFSHFAQSLAGKSMLVQATYYVGKVETDGTEKAAKMHADQQRLLAHLKKHHFTYSLGYLLKSDGVFHEKGVDVNIAVDILVAAYENLCERIYLVSSDTDLIPAIKKAQEKGIIVEYVGFSHRPSRAMVHCCKGKRMFDRDGLLPFIQK